MGAHPFAGLSLDDNLTKSGSTNARAIEFTNTTGVAQNITDISICNNTIGSADGLTANVGLWMSFTNLGGMQRIKINGNSLQAVSETGALEYGLLLHIDASTTAAGCLFSSVTISDNTILDGVLTLDFDGVAVTGLDVSNNLVAALDVSQPTVERGCIDILLENTAAHPLVGCLSSSINGNQVSGAAYGIRWDAGGIFKQRDTQINGNQITVPREAGGGGGGDGIYYAARTSESHINQERPLRRLACPFKQPALPFSRGFTSTTT